MQCCIVAALLTDSWEDNDVRFFKQDSQAIILELLSSCFREGGGGYCTLGIMTNCAI
jgi:hypothetical protein